MEEITMEKEWGQYYPRRAKAQGYNVGRRGLQIGRRVQKEAGGQGTLVADLG